MTDISLLIENYDSTFKEIQELQTVFSNELLLNEGLMANLGKAWDAFRREHRNEKYTKAIQKATKADDSTITRALDIVKKALESRIKKLEEIKNKIKSHGDKELVDMLSQAMNDNEKQAKVFMDAANTLIDTISSKQTPQQQNQTQQTQSPPQQQSQTQQTQSPPQQQQQQPNNPQKTKNSQQIKKVLKNLNSDEGAKKLGNESNTIIANGAVAGKNAQEIVDELRNKFKNYDVTNDVKHAIGIALNLVNKPEDTSNLKENHHLK